MINEIPKKHFMNVAVFTSANKLEMYREETKKLGNVIGKNGCRLLTGGLAINGSLMNEVFKGYKESDPEAERARMFVPSCFYDENNQDMYAYQRVYPTIRDRQNVLVDEADVYVLNVGANGSLYEFLEAYITRQVKEHDRPICVINTYGYWDRLYELMLQFRLEGGASHPEKYVNWFKSVDEFEAWLISYKTEWEEKRR